MKFSIADSVLKPKTPLMVLAASLILSVAVALPVAPVQAAQSEQADKPAEQKKKRRVKRAQTLRPQIFKKLDAARALADEKKYDEALDELQALEKRKRNS